MGSLHSANPVAYDNGIIFRQKTAGINRLIDLNQPYVMLGNRRALQAHDHLLAQKAALSAIYLTMSGSNSMGADRNPYAKDFGRFALDLDRFNVFFNYFIGGLL